MTRAAITIPACVQDFIPEHERTPRVLAENWRYTPLNSLHLVKPVALLQNDVHVIKTGTTHTLIDTASTDETVRMHQHIMLEAGATLNHIRILPAQPTQHCFIRTQVVLGQGAQYHLSVLAGGAATMRQEFHIDLTGQGAACTLAAAYILKEQAHHDLVVNINHQAPSCHSHQNIRGLAAGAARGAFQGKIHVAQAAQETAAYQLHKALLLGDRASINAKPALEIYADRVKCSHGNTVGDFDAAALFYLQARGIAAPQARRLLAEAFVRAVFDDAPAQQEQLQNTAAAWLELCHDL